MSATIVVVEDNPIASKALRKHLEAAGYSVIECSDGASALLAAAKSPDLIIQDLVLPDMGGFELAQRLRASSGVTSVPIIAMSGLSRLLEQARADSSAFCTVLAKPFDFSELIALVREHVRPTASLGEHSAAADRSGALTVVRRLAELLGRQASLEAGLEEMVYTVLEVSGAKCGALYFANKGMLELRASVGMDDDALQKIRRFATVEAIAPVHQLISFDTPEHRTLLQSARAEQGLFVPLIVQGQVIGVFIALCEQSIDPSRQEVLLAAGVLMGQSIALGRAFTRVAKSEQQYRQLFESANDGIALVDTDTIIVDVNSKMAEVMQRDRAEIIGHSFAEFSADDDREQHRYEYESSLAAGQYQTAPIKLVGKAGAVHYLEFSNRMVEIDGRSLCLAVGRDVTERKRSDDEHRLFQTLMMAVQESDDLTDALRALLRQICEANAWDRCTIWMPREGVLELVATGTASAGTARGAGGESERACESTPNEATLRAWREAATVEFSALASAAVPIVVDDRVIAVIACFAATPAKEDADKLRRVAIVARRFGPLIQRRILEEKLARSHEQFLQAQKMEAVGKLTGGIAHDFNNILAVILTNVSLLMEGFDSADERYSDAKEIKVAAERAATLTRQLLAFSRKQVLAPRVLDLNQSIAAMKSMLMRIVGEDITISVRCDPALGAVRADPGQIEQVILNLVVNARDAMPRGGRLVIETTNVEREGIACVKLLISDSGCGMDEETQRRLFEPFFTTKEQGQGTGLGLSTSYGIVHQSGGHIDVVSGVGAGATFAIYLPRVYEVAAQVESTTIARATPGSETILLIEDDVQVCAVVTRLLMSKGYRVLAASNAPTALELVAAQPIDLVVSDVVMRGCNGPDLLQRLRITRPELRALFISGYTDHPAFHDGSSTGLPFLPKPFDPEELALKVREVLDAA